MQRNLIAMLVFLIALSQAAVTQAAPGDPPPDYDALQEPFREIPPAEEGMKLLYQMLAARDAGVRERAAWAIGDTGLAAAHEKLAERIKDEQDPDVLAQCARSMGMLKVKASAEAVGSLLRHESAIVKLEAAWAAGEIGVPRLVEPLGALAVSEADMEVATEAVRALGKIGRPDSVRSVLKAVDRGHPIIRLAAIRALGSFAPRKQEAVPVLLEHLKSDSVAERSAAVTSLRRLGAKEAAQAITKLIEDPHATARRSAVKALAELTGEQYKALIVGRTRDEDPMVRQEAAIQIGKQRILSADRDLLRLFADKHLYVRNASLDSFVSFDNPSVIALAGEGLGHKDAYTREYSSHALGLLKSNAHIQKQITLLTDPVQPVRAITAWALGEIGDPVASPALLAAAKKHKEDWETSRNAVISMGQLDYQEAAAWMRGVAPQKFKISYEVRKACTWSLGELRDKEAVNMLCGRIRDINPMTGEGLTLRFEAAVALGKIGRNHALDKGGERTATGTLSRFMKRDEEPNSMKYACRWALEQILNETVDYEIKPYPPSEKFYFINHIKKREAASEKEEEE